jgi:hypothetical protein
MAGDLPPTLSEFAVQLTCWLKATYPATPAMPESAIEEAVRDTWYRRHALIGTDL